MNNPYPPIGPTGAARPGSATRRAVLQGTSVAAVAGAAGFAYFKAKGPESGQRDRPAAKPTGTVLAKLSDVPAGGGLVLTGAKLVLTRGSGDDVRAFSAVCTHQGCLVNEISGGSIRCPCHGSVFDASTGAVTQGPASSPLSPVAVSVDNANIVAN